MPYALLRSALVLITINAAACCQSAAINGQITGTVTDPAGAPVGRARIEAVGIHTGYQQATFTSAAGQYRLWILPLGQYSITVEASGFATYRRTGIELNAGATATIDISLLLKGVTTEVVVDAAAPIVDISRIDQGNTLSSEEIENLPLVSRNPFNFILQQPNVSATATLSSAFPGR